MPPPATRILGIDYGEKRMGLALSDPLGITAQPLETLEVESLGKTLKSLEALLGEKEVERVVIGLPLNMDGSEGAMAARARKFGARLQGRTGRPVDYWDERLTSVASERVLIEAGLSRDRRRRTADRLAAALILASYLEWRRRV
ncbi:MAG TPA: Holliday junction resolvase RuvX [bacterium]|nr:Holliday junction resolvase RuvX [bacterium]